MAWKYVGACFGDKFIIEGVDIFKEEWENTGKDADVVDPQYGQHFIFTVWKVTKGNIVVVFAAGEFSNSVFGIYINK